MTTLSDLITQGVNTVRLSYPDLHGIARGKEFPAALLRAAGGGRRGALRGDHDRRPAPQRGRRLEHGFQDIVARPDPDTLVRIPWDPTVAWCLADLERMDGTPYGVDSRGALRRAVAAFEALDLGLTPVMGPELEFYLAVPDETAPNGYRSYVDNDSHVYTVGNVADPHGVLREMLHACADLGLGAFAANHEFGRAQYEINLRHSDALDAADRAFRFKDAVKEMSAAPRACWPRSSASRGTTTRAPASTCTCRWPTSAATTLLNGPRDGGALPAGDALHRRPARARPRA